VLASYATGILVLCVVLVAWVAVQRSWRKVFPGGDVDVLAGRMGCHGLCEPDECSRRCSQSQESAEEGNA